MMAISNSTLITVLYADVFAWPLTKEELKTWNIGYAPGTLAHTSAAIEHIDQWYVVKGKRRLIAERKKRERWAKEKWPIAHRAGKWLQRIPSLTLVGVTGGLSRNNVADQDDIDLFCVTAPGTIWISRLCAILLTDMLGLRRKAGDVEVKNKICLNMFMSEGDLGVSRQERDLFTAYEVLQMQPLWERGDSYKKFLKANRWVSDFLPRAWRERAKSRQYRVYRKKIFLSAVFSLLFTLFEPLARVIQLWYMARRRTSEVIRPNLLRFHPRDARIWVKEAFGRRLSVFNLPLDKIFYGR